MRRHNEKAYDVVDVCDVVDQFDTRNRDCSIQPERAGE